MQHLLPSAQSEEPDGNGDSEDDAQELKMACFMGLISYLADRSEVLRVSPFHAPRPLNAVARAIVQSAGIELTPLSDAGLDGTGEVVQVTTVCLPRGLYSLPTMFVCGGCSIDLRDVLHCFNDLFSTPRRSSSSLILVCPWRRKGDSGICMHNISCLSLSSVYPFDDLHKLCVRSGLRIYPPRPLLYKLPLLTHAYFIIYRLW